jgi:predicted nucleic acid-binding protein
MILADTSVWIDHLRVGNARLRDSLNEGAVLCHLFVIGELACGNLRQRDEILSLLAALPDASVATHEEVLAFVSEHGLHGKGLGWIDVHLLASAMLSKCQLWTLDKALEKAARRLGLSGPGRSS